ncbi:MAG TPA: hypothetical protein PLQ76_09000, partial [bacterium]|nr:hypothetical protein [bacterium]
GSPYFEKLIEEIEKHSREDACDFLLHNLSLASETEEKAVPGVPISRLMIIAARTLLRISSPEKRLERFIAALHYISIQVGSFKKDSELKFNLHIDNFPSEPFISPKSILKGLSDEENILAEISKRGALTDKEKYILSLMSSEF